MTASATDIAAHLAEIPMQDRFNYNWGCSPIPKFWDIDEDTYINGIIMTIDFDLDFGSLLEIVERKSGVVSYLVMLEFSNIEGEPHWDTEWYPNPVGTFFDRNVSQLEVSRWALDKIHGLYDSWYDGKRASLERTKNVSLKED